MDHIGAPPLGYKARSPRPEDLDAVLALIRAAERADEGNAELTADDLRGAWTRARFDPAMDAFLVTATDGSAAAYGDVWPREGYTLIQADGHVHPAQRGRGLGRWLLRTLEVRAREIAEQTAPGQAAVIQSIFFHGATETRDLFVSEGYALALMFWRMVIDMDELPLPLAFPEGANVRTFREEDALAVHDLIITAFADNEEHRISPYEEWRGFMMARETFKPELWFLAEADGRIVAAALCPDYDDHGWLRQFAVAKEYRGRGIGSALLRHVFREQFARGNRSVGLVVNSWNRTGAKAVYERAGMHLDRQHDAYEKVIRPA